MLTTQFFGMKIQRYMHEYGITANTLAKVAAKAFRNGSLNENAWRRKPFTEEEIESAPMLSNPLTQYMFCSPGEGGVALVLCQADKAADFTDAPVYLKSAVLRSRPFGSFEVFSPWLPSSGATRRRWPRPRAPSRWPASARTRSTSCRCRTPSRAPR